MVNVKTLLEAFLNMSLRSAGFIDEAFSLVKIKISSKRQIIRISELPDSGLKEFCCLSNIVYSKTWSFTKFVIVQKFLYVSNHNSIQVKLNYTAQA
jgi:hypothetical protein